MFDNWVELVLGRVFFRNTSVQVYRANGHQMICDHRFADAGSIVTAVSSPMYRQLLKQANLPRQIRVVDVGANVGGFCLLLASMGHEIRDLICIEMNPNTARRLRFNVESNWPGAQVVNCGIAGERREVQLSLGGGDTGDNIYRGSAKKAGGSVSVTCRLLDDVSGVGRIDVLKLDIEGAEEEMFATRGYEETLGRTDVLVIEIHHERSASDVHRAIEESGLRWLCAAEGRVSGQIGQHVFVRPS